jgi:anti-sigma regulatory factor (Ser/Thr protein kinase)
MTQNLSVSLDANASSPRFARALADTFLHHCGLDRLLETTGLLVSELVTNSVLHAGSGIRLEMVGTFEGIRVDVFDASTALAIIGLPDTLSESGRGLHLVDSLANNWGSERVPDGKVTWFELADTPETDLQPRT